MRGVGAIADNLALFVVKTSERFSNRRPGYGDKNKVVVMGEVFNFLKRNEVAVDDF